MNKILRRAVILILFLSCAKNNAQVQTWIDYTTNNWINSIWLYNGDYGFRGLLTVDEWTQYTINPAFLFRQDKELTFHAGVRLFYTDNKAISDQIEARPWQGVGYIWPHLKNLRFDHYLRLEERFVWQTDSDDFDFSLRSRYRLRMKTMDFLLPLIPTKFTSSFSFELFMDITKEIVETYVGRNRMTFGIGNYITDDILIELNFILQRSRKEVTSNEKSVDKIFRLRIKHNLSSGLLFH